MHPICLLKAMVEDRRREPIFETAAVRLGRRIPGSQLTTRVVRSVRRAVGDRLVRVGQGLSAGPVPAVATES